MRRALAPMGRFPSTFTATLVTEPPCSKAMGGVSLQPPATPRRRHSAGSYLYVYLRTPGRRPPTCQVQSGGTLHLMPLLQRGQLAPANGDEGV